MYIIMHHGWLVCIIYIFPSVLWSDPLWMFPQMSSNFPIPCQQACNIYSILLTLQHWSIYFVLEFLFANSLSLLLYYLPLTPCIATSLGFLKRRLCRKLTISVVNRQRGKAVIREQYRKLGPMKWAGHKILSYYIHPCLLLKCVYSRMPDSAIPMM